jgi:uncharacterized membrane protein
VSQAAFLAVSVCPLSGRSGHGTGPATRAAPEILTQRYARGGIGKGEVEQKMRDLQG